MDHDEPQTIDFHTIQDQLEEANGEVMELKKMVEQDLSERQMDRFGHHLTGVCDEAYEGLIQGFDKLMNGAYHSSGDLRQKAELLSKFDFGR